MPTVVLHGLETTYETHGEGPALLAIMGLTGSRGHWMGFPERFADRYQVITFDNRGITRPAPMGPYSALQMAGDALALLDHLGVERANVFGVSMGGMIAQELVLRAPKRVKKLILGCTHPGGATALPPLPEVIAAFAGMGKDGPEASIRRLLTANFSDRFVAEHADVVEQLVQYGLEHRMPSLGFQGQLAAVTSHNTVARLGAIEVPTLLLTGDQDKLIPDGNTALLADAIPGARAVTFAGAGHMFWVEAADAAEAAMRAFLDG